MQKSYYLFNPGRLERQDNTLRFTPRDESGEEGQPRFIPVESATELFVFGALDANSALYNFLGKHHIAVHFFDFYEHYTGSFMPKEYLLAGKVQVQQTGCYLDKKKRLEVARLILDGASFNMLKVLRYYHNRDKDLSAQLEAIETHRAAFGGGTQHQRADGIGRQHPTGILQRVRRDPQRLRDGRTQQTPAQKRGQRLGVLWQHALLFRLSEPDLPHPTQSHHQFFARTGGEALFLGPRFGRGVQTLVGGSDDLQPAEQKDHTSQRFSGRCGAHPAQRNREKGVCQSMGGAFGGDDPTPDAQAFRQLQTLAPARMLQTHQTPVGRRRIQALQNLLVTHVRYFGI